MVRSNISHERGVWAYHSGGELEALGLVSTNSFLFQKNKKSTSQRRKPEVSIIMEDRHGRLELHKVELGLAVHKEKKVGIADH